MTSKIEQLVKKLIQTNTKDIRENSAEYKLLYEHWCRRYVEEKMNKKHLRAIKVQVKNLTYKDLKEAGARIDSIYNNNQQRSSRSMNIDLENENEVPRSPKAQASKHAEKEENKKDLRCQHCDRRGHVQKDCWTKFPEKRPERFNTGSSGTQTTKLTCSLCKRRGHKTDDCYQLKKYSELEAAEQKKRESLTCTHCNRKGHLLEDCRSFQRSGREARSNATRTTRSSGGANQSQ